MKKIASAVGVVALASAIFGTSWYWSSQRTMRATGPAASIATQKWASPSILTSATAKPRTPLAVIRLQPNANAALIAWASGWENSRQTGDTPAEKEALGTLVAASDFSADDRFVVAKLLTEAGDSVGAMIWGRAAMDRAPADLATAADADALAATLLAELDVVGPLFWQAGDLPAVKSLLAVEALLPRHNEWDQKPEWHRVNYVRALMQAQAYDEALAEGGRIEKDIAAGNNAFNADQLATLRRLQSTCLTDTGQLTKAKAILDVEAQSEDPKLAAAAAPMLAELNRRMQTPLAIVQANPAAPPELTAWAQRWEAAPADAKPHEIGLLRRTLAPAGMSGGDALSLGQLLELAGDRSSAAACYQAGVRKVHEEYKSAHDAGQKPKQIIGRLKPQVALLGRAATLLWEAHDAEAELMISEMTREIPAVNDADQGPEWAMLAHAEALASLDRFDEATAETDQIATEITTHGSRFTDGQKTEFSWLQVLILLPMGRREEALPYLRMIVKDTSFHHSDSAWQTLVLILCKLGRTEEAESFFAQYQHSGGAGPSDLAILSAVLQDAKYGT